MTQDTNVEFNFYVADDYADLSNATDEDGFYLDASTTTSPSPGVNNWAGGDIYHYPTGINNGASIWLGPRPHPKAS